MEAFSLLKYWRGNSGRPGVSVAGDACANVRPVGTTSASSTTTTIVSAASHHQLDSDEEDKADEGPFFDLEFTVADDVVQVKREENNDDIICVVENDKESSESEESDGESETELKFALSSASSGDSIDPNVSLSPSDDLFFKGRLVPLSEPNGKPLKSATKATKFGVLMLKLKKSAKAKVPENAESEESAPEMPKKPVNDELENNQRSSKPHGKFFTVNFKVDEVPIVSLFTRDNSSKGVTNKGQKGKLGKLAEDDDKAFSKDMMMNRYLKKVKPLYVRVSKRYGEKLGFSGQLNGLVSQPPSTEVRKSPPAEKSVTESPKVSQVQRLRNVKSQKLGSLPAGLRVVRKHLGQSRSAVAASPPAQTVSKRRDDSLLQQQDGIQSAIMHCKRSFKASRDLEASSESVTVSDESQEKSA